MTAFKRFRRPKFLSRLRVWLAESFTIVIPLRHPVLDNKRGEAGLEQRTRCAYQAHPRRWQVALRAERQQRQVTCCVQRRNVVETSPFLRRHYLSLYFVQPSMNLRLVLHLLASAPVVFEPLLSISRLSRKTNVATCSYRNLTTSCRFTSA